MIYAPVEGASCGLELALFPEKKGKNLLILLVGHI
jgi:hypothetical protein